jgi:BASS family bile acid:Na+ symporter
VTRGNVALAVALTTVSTLGCVVTAPLLLRLLAADVLPPDFAFPTWPIMRDVTAYLLVPLGVGLLVREKLPGHAKPIAAWSIRASIALIVILSILALGSKRIEPMAYGWFPPAIILTFVLTLVTFTPYLVRAFGRYDDDAAALGLGITLRNMGVGLLLVRFFFPGEPENGHVLFTCLFYAGAALPCSIPLVIRHRRGRSALVVGAPKPRPVLSPNETFP